MQSNNYICNGEFCVLNHGNYFENEVNQGESVENCEEKVIQDYGVVYDSNKEEIYIIKENDDILGYTFSEMQCIDFINKYFEDFKNRNMGSNYILERRSESSFLILENLFMNLLVSSYERTVCSLSFVMVKGI
jgi:hypothetical protein